MRYAIVETRGRSEAGRSGERAKCPGCGADVVAKVGAVVVPHWAHMATADCDSSRDPETPWHRAIKDALAAPECQEVVFFNTDENGRRTVARRADVCCDDVVVEVQRSPISIDEVVARSDFYRSRGFEVVWIFHKSLMGGARGSKLLFHQIRQSARPFWIGIMNDNMQATFATGDHVKSNVWQWTHCEFKDWSGDAAYLIDRVKIVALVEKTRAAREKARNEAAIAAAEAERRAPIDRALAMIREVSAARDDWAWWGMPVGKAQKFSEFLSSASEWIKGTSGNERALTFRQYEYLRSIHSETMSRWERARASAHRSSGVGRRGGVW